MQSVLPHWNKIYWSAADGGQGGCCVWGLNETHVTFSQASFYIFQDAHSCPKAAFPFARSEWRVSFLIFAHTGHPHKDDEAVCSA